MVMVMVMVMVMRQEANEHLRGVGCIEWIIINVISVKILY
jgi:hypothetical protein